MFLYMRLSKKEIQVILRVAKEIYGEGVEIYLFGSRIMMRRKEGILICLYVVPRSEKAYWLVSGCWLV